MTRDELQECSRGELFIYYRQLLGLRQEDIATHLDTSQRTISTIEQNKFIAEDILHKLTTKVLGLESQNILDKNFELKKTGERIPDELLQQVFEGPYLFAEYIQNLEPYTLTSADKGLMNKLKLRRKQLTRERSMNITGDLLKLVREAKEVSIGSLSQKTSLNRQYLSKLELRKHQPIDLTIVRFLNGLGYDIHHPITHYILGIFD